MNSQRDSGIDCLRLVCMMMVVSMHYFGWGGANNSPETTRINFLLASGISVFCHVAVNCFYLITGYYIKGTDSEITGKKFKTSIVNIYPKIWFYSVSVYIMCCVFGITDYSGKELTMSFFPIISNRWWFMTVFMLLLCIKPFIGKLLVKLTNKEITIFLLSIAFFDCFQAIIGHNAFAERGAGFLHAFFMMCLGYGIKRFIISYNKYPPPPHIFLILYIVTCIIAGGCAIIGKMVLKKEDAVALYYNSPLIVIASFALFSFFATWKRNWIWTSWLAPYTLAIYLINDHPAMQANIYQKVLFCNKFYSSNFMMIHFLACVLGFIILGIVIDFFVTQIIQRLKKSPEQKRVS